MVDINRTPNKTADVLHGHACRNKIPTTFHLCLSFWLSHSSPPPSLTWHRAVSTDPSCHTYSTDRTQHCSTRQPRLCWTWQLWFNINGKRLVRKMLKLKLKFGTKTVKFLSPCFGCMMFVLGLVLRLCFLGVLWWNLNSVCSEIQEIQKSWFCRSHLLSPLISSFSSLPVS
jgi:hypothetical protein